jgi:hypothetical protein
MILDGFVGWNQREIHNLIGKRKTVNKNDEFNSPLFSILFDIKFKKKLFE